MKYDRFIKLTVISVCAVLLFALLTSCGNEKPPVITDSVTDAPKETGTTAPITDPVTENTSAQDTDEQINSTADVTTATTTSEPSTDPITEPVDAPAAYQYDKPVPESAKRDVSWFDDAVFVGDSRVGGFQLTAGVWNAEYITFAGMDVGKFFTYSLKPEGEPVYTANDALRDLGTNYKKVYIGLGLNELGWSYYSAYYNKLCEIIDTIRSYNPDADIYLMTVLPVSEQRSKQVSYETLENVDLMNNRIKQAAVEKQVYFVDVDTAFRDAKGYLPEGYSTDGVHLNREPNGILRDYLLTHTVEK